jgi:membrane protease YdiL (CAAX protease family)
MHPLISSAIHHIKTHTTEILLHILIVFIFPVFLIKAGVIPIHDRVVFLVVMVSFLLVVLVQEKWTPNMLGLSNGTTKKYYMQYALFTLLGVLMLVAFGEKTGHEELARWWMHRHFLYLFFIVSLFQEVAYRGYLIPALGKIFKNPVLIVLTNALLFTFLHIIFPSLTVSLPLAFVGGVGFAVMYIKYPSLTLIILSHSVLNFCAVLYGFFVIPGVTY